MAKTISNLLVGIGFDLDKKSTDKVGSGIDSIKSKALKLGGVVAGAFGIKALTSDFANAKDDLGKFSEVFGSTANNINAFGNALKLEGGTLGGFMNQLASLEKFRAGLAVGDAGFIAAAGRAGLDTQALIQAKNATEGYLALADQFQRMTKQQRINAADALGLDEASIRLLAKGRTGIEQVVEQQKKMRPITDAMTKSSAVWNDELQNLGTNIGGFADRISGKVLPQINNLIIGTNEWLSSNQGVINSGIDGFLNIVGDNLLAIGVAVTALTAGSSLGIAGKAIGAIGSKANIGGLSKVGSLVGKLGKGFGVLGAAMLAWEVGTSIGEKINESLGDDVKANIGGFIANIAAHLGVDEAEAAVRFNLPNKYKSDYDKLSDAEKSARANISNQDFTVVEKAKEERAATRIDKNQLNVATDKKQQPIIIHNQTILDGKVIDTKIVKVVGGMADQAIQDLTSTEGG